MNNNINNGIASTFVLNSLKNLITGQKLKFNFMLFFNEFLTLDSILLSSKNYLNLNKSCNECASELRLLGN